MPEMAQMSGAGARVRIEGLGHEFSGAAGGPVLKGIDLTIEPGANISIVGPSGCGKTTLLNAVAGLIEPTAGRVERSNARIGLVPQRPGLLGWRTLRQNVALPLELSGAADAAARVDAAIELVGMSRMADRYPHELSGGMQSRAAIARAIVSDPQLILLDEPFGALDELTGHELMIALSAVLARGSATVLMITHSLAHAVFLADRVLVMAPGPGRVASTLDVDAPQPRTREFFDSDVFNRAVSDVRARLWEAK